MHAGALSGKETARQYSVMLPCEPDQFREFISGLLGKPQTITQRIVGTYEIRKQDLVNIHHLIAQRIEQQNHGSLIQFTTRIGYNDDSSVVLNSLDDLHAYHEVRPVISTKVFLSFIFLIKFANKAVAEKQVIEISFETYIGKTITEEFDSLLMQETFKKRTGNVSFCIQHTARTWGSDIQGLLSSHLKNLIVEDSKIKSSITQHNGKISVFMGFMIFALAFYSIYQASLSLISSQQKSVSRLLGGKVETIQKIDGLLDIIYKNPWDGFLLSSIGYLVFAFFLMICVSLWIESSTSSRKPSFILLSSAAEKDMVAQLSSYRAKWFSFAGSVVFSVVTGLVSCVIFANYWTS